MRTQTSIAAFLVALIAGTAHSQVATVDLDWYPVIEMRFMALGEDEAEQIKTVDVGLLAGALQMSRRPHWVKVRVTPLVYERFENEHHIHAVFLAAIAHLYDSRHGPRHVLRTPVTDPARSSLLLWRTKSKDAYLSGGVSVLLGQAMAHYGYRAADGSRYRAWKLTDALTYKDNEKHGRRIDSLWGWVFATEWDRSKKDRPWRFSLLQRCLAVGSREGKTYGRLLWIPVGDAPPFWSQLWDGKKSGETETPSPESKPPRTRIRI